MPSDVDLGPVHLHACFFDPECQQYDAPKRLYVHTPYGSLIMGARTQAWVPFVGMLDPRHGGSWWKFWPVVWHPASRG